MIVFELICPQQHRFEGWFASAGDFDGQKARGLLSCPSCGNSGIEKLLTAKIGSAEAVQAPARPHGRIVKKNSLPISAQTTMNLHELIDQVLKSTEDVGPKFAEEARRMHYAEVPERAIRGTASRQETEDLLDEGISVMPLPIPPQGDWH